MGLRTDAKALLLAAVDTGSRAAGDLAAIEAVCTAAGALEVFAATDAVEAAELLRARRLAHPAMEKFAADTYPEGSGGIIVDDIAVPRTALAAMLDGIEKIADRVRRCRSASSGTPATATCTPTSSSTALDPDSVARGQGVFDEIMRLGLAMGGTCTGEHGVGLLKQDWLAQEIGPVGMAVHRAIKHALDPTALLNPGKVL